MIALVQEEFAARTATAARSQSGGLFGSLFGGLFGPSAIASCTSSGSGLGGAMRACLPCLDPTHTARGAGGYGDESPGIGVRATPYKSAMKKDEAASAQSAFGLCKCCLPAH